MYKSHDSHQYTVGKTDTLCRLIKPPFNNPPLVKRKFQIWETGVNKNPPLVKRKNSPNVYHSETFSCHFPRQKIPFFSRGASPPDLPVHITLEEQNTNYNTSLFVWKVYIIARKCVVCSKIVVEVTRMNQTHCHMWKYNEILSNNQIQQTSKKK